MHGVCAARAISAGLRDFEEKPIWEGVVHVFDLIGHRIATRAYAGLPRSGEHEAAVLRGAASAAGG